MSDHSVSRRNFMIRTIIGVFAFIGAAVAVPLGGLGILPALKKHKADWSDIGSLADIGINEPQERRFFETVIKGWREEKVERAVWLVRRAGENITAFSPNCPHLGCGYRWIASERRFVCPCHASVFDMDGNVLSGPSPRRLDALETKTEKGRVWVKYEVFQLGIKDKTIA